jgi:hypothetical protein
LPAPPPRGATLSDPPASAASEFFSKRKRDGSPRNGGLKNRLPIREAGGCSAFIPPHPALPHQGGGKNWRSCSSPTLTLSQHHGRMCGLLSAPGGNDLPEGQSAGEPERGTYSAFLAGKACLRMPHSPDRTVTTAWLVPPNRSVVSIHFSRLPPCPIRLRVPHPSSFPKESGMGRPGTAGQKSALPNQGAVDTVDRMDENGQNGQATEYLGPGMQYCDGSLGQDGCRL